jgi:hypothetical protein
MRTTDDRAARAEPLRMAPLERVETGREVWAEAGLAAIPRILTLQDRDPHSPTYGCFDRDHWHYRVSDFASGMAQELVWPLALAFDSAIPGSPYAGQEAVRDWVIAGIGFAARSAHADGSCDDYYVHERAVGAAAFSLLAVLEAARRVRWSGPALERLVRRRADWLARREESGRLSNHEALTALGLVEAGRALGTDRWREAAARRLERVLSWQHPEGWFVEYEGCDPGYQTLTIGALAELAERGGAPGLEAALDRAVGLVADLMHPDGTLGGELGSRSTHAFFPHGFERLGRRLPLALAVNDLAREALARGRSACHDDDHLIGHHAWSRLLAWEAHVPERPPTLARPEGRRWLPHAGLIVDRRGEAELFLSTRKGGSFRLFRGGVLVAADTQVSLLVRRGRGLRNAVGHLVAPSRVEVEPDGVTVRGRLSWARRTRMTPARLIALRALMLGPGRWAPDLVRAALQRLLITGRDATSFHYERELRWDAGRWRVRDTVAGPRWRDVEAAGIGGHQTSSYVVMSRVFSAAQLAGWLDLGPAVRALVGRQPLVVEREL